MAEPDDLPTTEEGDLDPVVADRFGFDGSGITVVYRPDGGPTGPVEPVEPVEE